MAFAWNTRVFFIAAAGVAAALATWSTKAPSQNTSTTEPLPTPVAVATVERRDVAQSVSGIGTVQSLHTVTLRPQIDGVVTEVLFREGQAVKEGDLLARIDDRSIRAALMQAEAEKARSEAQLRGAELDLARYK